VFRCGQKSPTIALAQRALRVGADGAFGPATFRALVKWQASHGVPVTGVLDKATWARLLPAPAHAPAPAPAPAPPATQQASAFPTVGQALPAAGATSSYAAYRSVVLRVGARGEAVRALQRALGGLAADGSFGPRTQAVLAAWQKSQGLAPNGVVDRGVWDRLEARGNPLSGYRSTVLRRGSSGPAVVALQHALGISADGSFGPMTEAAVKNAQGRANLARTGVVAALTWQAIEALVQR
jgi:peptidoglycan hydrolase-like protein with peptidoglycan-binding domain